MGTTTVRLDSDDEALLDTLTGDRDNLTTLASLLGPAAPTDHPRP